MLKPSLRSLEFDRNVQLGGALYLGKHSEIWLDDCGEWNFCGPFVRNEGEGMVDSRRKGWRGWRGVIGGFQNNIKTQNNKIDKNTK